MFGSILNEIEHRGHTIQVPVASDRLVPGIQEIKDKRVFTLEYDGTVYPCLDKAWMSWADKILKPKDAEKDTETGRKKRWSTATIRKFLDMTDPELAEQIIRRWWENHDAQEWNVIKYADNGDPNPIRYIGTDRYRLYRHDQFLKDLSESPFVGMRLQQSFVNENRLVLRITEPEPLPIAGNEDIFAGFHIMNSENGSSSIIIKYLIFDLVCTNGLMVIIGSNIVLMQKHSSFDVAKFRARVVECSDTLPMLHNTSIKAINNLIDLDLTYSEVEAILTHYQKEYDASNKFLDNVLEEDPENGWALLSAITKNAQSYNWETRMSHELNAAKLIHDIYDGKHLKYLEIAQHG